MAIAKNGKCLSEECHTIADKIRWECKHGHVWSSRLGSVLAGRWCPQCSYDAKRSSEPYDFATKKGGRLVSKYTNNQSRLTWECKHGHRWKANFSNIKKCKWCPFCAGNARLTIDKMRTIAFSKRGTCLSPTYKNNHTKLQWRCYYDHEWIARPADILDGKWCPICARLNKKAVNR